MCSSDLFGLHDTPIVMAGGVWCLREWQDFIGNPDVGPIAFQFGTRPLLTKESPISEEWKRRLLTLKKGDVLLHRFSPTGFYSSAVRNTFLNELAERSKRQVAFAAAPVGELDTAFHVGARGRVESVADDDAGLLRWLAEVGIVPGTELEVRQLDPSITASYVLERAEREFAAVRAEMVRIVERRRGRCLSPG